MRDYYPGHVSSEWVAALIVTAFVVGALFGIFVVR